MTIFAAASHYNFMNIYREMHSRKKNGRKATVLSVVSISILYFLVGIFGYLCFGDQTSANVLTNFAQSGSKMAEAANILVIPMMIFHYPTVAYANRRAIEELLF